MSSLGQQDGRHPTTNRAKPPVTTALLERRAHALERFLPSAVEGDVKGVHQARVASRRLREAIPVLAKGLKGSKAKKARKQIRKLTRALGTVRELDVSLGILDELAQKPGVPRNALEDVRAHVIGERDKRRTEMLERVASINSEKLGRRLESVALALSGANDMEWRARLGARILKRAKRLTASIREAGQMYEADRLHQVRIAAKKLRYALELAAEGPTPAARPLVSTLKKAQEALGRLHDLHVLQHHIAAVQVVPMSTRTSSDGGLDAISRAMEEECRRLHARYLTMAPALGEIAIACRTTIGPQVSKPPVVRRPVKMALAERPRRESVRRA